MPRVPRLFNHLACVGADNLLVDRYLRSLTPGAPALSPLDQARLGVALGELRFTEREQMLWEHRFRPHPTRTLEELACQPPFEVTPATVRGNEVSFFGKVVRHLDAWEAKNPITITSYRRPLQREHLDALVLADLLAPVGKPLCEPFFQLRAEIEGLAASVPSLLTQPRSPRMFPPGAVLKRLERPWSFRPHKDRRQDSGWRSKHERAQAHAEQWIRVVENALRCDAKALGIRDFLLPLLDRAFPDSAAEGSFEVERAVASAVVLCQLTWWIEQETPFRWAKRQLREASMMLWECIDFNYYGGDDVSSGLWMNETPEVALQRWARVLANVEASLLTV